jgi:hypothetical protein
MWKMAQKTKVMALICSRSLGLDDYRLEFLRGMGVEVVQGNKSGDTSIFNYKPSAIVFDHMGTWKIKDVLTGAFNHGIKTFSVPHGIDIYTDGLHAKRRVRKWSACPEKGVPHGFDYLMLVGTFGSARYCKEWMDIHEHLYPRHFASDHDTPGLKVGYMSAFAGGQMNKDQVNYMLAHLPEDCLNITFAVGPNRRILETISVPDGILIDRKYNTSEIIEWCDVMLVSASCTTAECIMKGKPAYLLRHTHDRGISYQDSGTLHVINNYDELVSTLRNREIYPNTPEPWITDYIYTKKYGSKVLDAYVDFILEKL